MKDINSSPKSIINEESENVRSEPIPGESTEPEADPMKGESEKEIEQAEEEGDDYMENYGDLEDGHSILPDSKQDPNSNILE